MCEFCEKNEAGNFRELTDDCLNGHFYADLEYGSLYLEYDDETTDYALVSINFCPMCGRKLAERDA